MRKKMSQVPNIYIADHLVKDWPHAGLETGEWVLARPEGYWGLNLLIRFRVAWKVFTGEWDALKWIEQ